MPDSERRERCERVNRCSSMSSAYQEFDCRPPNPRDTEGGHQMLRGAQASGGDAWEYAGERLPTKFGKTRMGERDVPSQRLLPSGLCSPSSESSQLGSGIQYI